MINLIGQRGPHEYASILLDRAGAEQLLNLLTVCLKEAHSGTVVAALEVMASDGEGYDLTLAIFASEGEWPNPRYTDPIYSHQALPDKP